MIALDGNPNAGSLAYRVRRETSNTITGLLTHRNAINRDVELLEVHYNLVCLNTGTGVLESASKRILQLVPQTAP